MKLLTKEILDKIPSLYAQEKVKDPIVYVKLFHPLSSWKFFATEYDPKERIFFGWNPMDGELGYASLSELESTKVRGLGIERDTGFGPKPLSWVKAGREHERYAMPKDVSRRPKRKTRGESPGRSRRGSMYGYGAGMGGMR